VAGRRLIVEADGGSRGNPGNAGYGALVRDALSGEVIAQRAESIGIASNNVAEYSGLVAGLKAASEIDPRADVTVRLDSKLIVEQMSGRWKVKSPEMRRLALWAAEIAGEITAAGGSVTYNWIPREENTAADALANSAMDGKAVSWTGQLPDAEASEVQPPDVGQPTRILLVRHGVTDFTAQGKLDGRGGADPGLNGQGWAQAHAAGAGVHAFIGDRSATLITSSLQRAVETGGAIADEIGVGPQVDADWDEQNFGDWDGVSMGYLAASHPQDLLRFREDPQYSRPGGETHVDLQARVVGAFERAVAVGDTVVVATHRKPIMTVLAHVLGIPHERIWRLATAPASLTCIEVWADGGLSVGFVNDTSHMH
jgi:probable phosphoglycerate mutase